MTNYQVTICYKAIININVKADNEIEARQEAVEIMKVQRDKMFRRRGFDLQDDNFKADGVLDMDATWNQF